MKLRIGYLQDDLGEVQARALAKQLFRLAKGVDIDLAPVPAGETRPGEGNVFASPLEIALMNRDAEIAVTGLQDIGILVAEGVTLAAVTERIDPREAAITQTKLPLLAVPEGSTVLVDGPRRARQIKRLRADLEPVVRALKLSAIEQLVTSGEVAAGVVSLADLKWLGKEDSAAEIIGLEEMLPGPGQGSLGLLVHQQDSVAIKVARAVHHKPTWACVKAERDILAELGFNAYVPVGVSAKLEGDKLSVEAKVFGPDGEVVAEAAGAGPLEDSYVLTKRLAETLLSPRGEEALRSARASP